MLGKEPTITKCGKCGLDWLGTQKCSCGWRPDAKRHYTNMALGGLGLLLLGGAVYMLQNLHQYFPNEAEASRHFAIAEDEFGKENIQLAVEEYKTASMYNPHRVDIKRRLALALLNDKRPNEAVRAIEAARKIDPHNEELRKEHIGLLERVGEDKEAAGLLEGIAKDPHDKFHLASLYEKSGEVDKAITMYTEFTQFEPRRNGAWLAIARLQERKKENQKAIQTLRRAITFMPSDPALHQQLGITLGDSNQTEDAVKELVLSTELEPSAAEHNAELINSMKGREITKEYVIPLRRDHGALIVDAVLNGKVKVPMIVDTGASINAISPQVANQLKLSPGAGQPMIVGGVTGIAATRKFHLSSLAIGKVEQAVVPVTIIPRSSEGYGLLGLPFLNRYRFTIDPNRSVLVLRPR